MGRPAKTLRIKAKDLWPSVIYNGSTIVRFLTGRRGRIVKVESYGKGKPRHKLRG